MDIHYCSKTSQTKRRQVVMGSGDNIHARMEGQNLVLFAPPGEKGIFLSTTFQLIFIRN